MTLAPMTKRKRSVSVSECHSSIFEPYSYRQKCSIHIFLTVMGVFFGKCHLYTLLFSYIQSIRKICDVSHKFSPFCTRWLYKLRKTTRPAGNVSHLTK